MDHAENTSDDTRRPAARDEHGRLEHRAEHHKPDFTDPVVAVNTAPVVAIGLIGGYGVARATGNRPLGGAVLAAAGIYAGRTWLARRGPVVAAGLGATYVLGFGLSHPLAKKIGAWPSVLAVTAVSAAAAHYLSDTQLSLR
ncbi:hypothetical protein [Brachybacterium huguangmaarense]|uniref:hypothetical protein n=1 Tax=Brachybacterium huguangmaarense TaxID=1652028 RepID=UPI0037BEC148